MKWSASLGSLITLAGVIAAIVGYEKLKGIFSNPTTSQAFADSHPNLAALGISLGLVPKGTKQPDTTGTAGQQAEENAYTAVVNDQSQGFYNSALQEFSFNAGLDTALAGQGTDGWPWLSYAAWVAAGYPPLPTAQFVMVDAHGVYHNEYE